jgi:hypothetical protein
MRARTVRQLGLLVSAAATGLLLAACGGGNAPGLTTTTASPPAHDPTSGVPSPGTSSGGGNTAKATKACEIVTNVEAATAVGATGKLAVKTSTADECEYDASNGMDSVEISTETEEYDPEVVNLMMSMLDKASTTKLTGLGDAALEYRVGQDQTQMHIWVHGKYLVIIVTRISGGTTQAAAEALARTAITRV